MNVICWDVIRSLAIELTAVGKLRPNSQRIEVLNFNLKEEETRKLINFCSFWRPRILDPIKTLRGLRSGWNYQGLQLLLKRQAFRKDVRVWNASKQGMHQLSGKSHIFNSTLFPYKCLPPIKSTLINFLRNQKNTILCENIRLLPKQKFT